MTTPTLRLHRHPVSGHCHRVELFLSLLGLPFEMKEVDLPGGEHRRPAFLDLNPFGQVPVLQDGPVTLAESNAILVYLATRYDESGRWLPKDPLGAARVQRWFSISSGQLVAGPAAARRAAIFKRPIDQAAVAAIAADLFRLMDRFLSTSPFLVGDAPTLADVAMYAYTARAPEGGISLEPYPAISAWLARMEALPRFAPMGRTETQ
jgi:glutathione S-transferase